jgi:zinc/manganese transport system substrate-binding protein
LILNGAGYDPWAGELANSAPGIRRTELNVGDNVGVPPGGNPYLWYDPAYVQEAAALIVADYARIDPAGAAYFESRRKTFEDALVPYGKLVFKIKAAYPGTRVGASTPIAVPLVSALGLRLVTPAPFLQAMLGGTAPSPAGTAAASVQISRHEIRIYLYDGRSRSPAVRAQVAQARAAGIPAVPLSAMLTPANATFQQWQTGAISGVAQALEAARGR